MMPHNGNNELLDMALQNCRRTQSKILHYTSPLPHSSTPNTKSSLQSYVRQLSFTDDTSTSSVTPTQDHNDPTQRTQLIQTSIKIFCHKTMT